MPAKNRKHAFCIIAFNNWDLLEKLILLLDDPRNDIYIHINKYVKDFQPERFKKLVKKSDLYFTKRLATEWGTSGLMEVQLTFLELACPHQYAYYHMLSGGCLPIKTQDQIHQFFAEHAGREFVHYVSPPPVQKNIYERYAYYHYFKKYIRSTSKLKSFLLGVILENISVTVQKIFKIDRQKENRNILCYGSNWNSITGELAAFVLSRKESLLTEYRNTFAPDETFLQTLIYRSPYKTRLFYDKMDDNYVACARAIDWNRGNPYTWTSEEFQDLTESDYLFARKFDPAVDSKIIDLIYDYLSKKQNSSNTL